MMQPFTPAQQLYLNEVQENIRAAMEAMQKEIDQLRQDREKSHLT